MIINIYLNDFSAGVLMSYTHIKINVWNKQTVNANFLQFLTTVSTLHCKLSFNLSKIPLISLGWSKYSCVANFTLSFTTAWFFPSLTSFIYICVSISVLNKMCLYTSALIMYIMKPKRNVRALFRTNVRPWPSAQILQWSSDDREVHWWPGRENRLSAYRGIFWRISCFTQKRTLLGFRWCCLFQTESKITWVQRNKHNRSAKGKQYCLFLYILIIPFVYQSTFLLKLFREQLETVSFHNIKKHKFKWTCWEGNLRSFISIRFCMISGITCMNTIWMILIYSRSIEG